MPQLDPSGFSPQLVWLAISFVILYLVMARFALPRIGDVLEARQDRIAHDLDAAESLKAEAEAVLADYERSIAEARSAAREALVAAADQRARDAAARHAKLETRIAEQLREAEERIASAKKEALDNVAEVAGEIAEAATEKLIGALSEAAAARAAPSRAQKEKG